MAADVLAFMAENRGQLGIGERYREPGTDQHPGAHHAVGEGEQRPGVEHDQTAVADSGAAGIGGQPR